MQSSSTFLLSVTTKSYIQKNSHDYKCTTDELSFLSKHFEKKIYSFFSKVGAYTVGIYSDFKIHSKSAKLERVKILFRFQRQPYMTKEICVAHFFQYIYFPWKIQSLYFWCPLGNFWQEKQENVHNYLIVVLGQFHSLSFLKESCISFEPPIKTHI